MTPDTRKFWGHVNPVLSFASHNGEQTTGGFIAVVGLQAFVKRFMAAPKQILSVGLLGTFVFVILSASLACADSRPFGVYQPGRAHAGHRAGLGRTAAHNFKAGFLVTKDDGPSRSRKNLYKSLVFTHEAAHAGGIVWVPEPSFTLPQTFILDLSPILNL